MDCRRRVCDGSRHLVNAFYRHARLRLAHRPRL
ncbi:DUF2379 family protein [Pseudomonas cannabina]